MKLYCQKCQKPFPVSAEAEPNSNVECPVCKEPHTVPENRTAPGVVIGDFLIESLLSRGGMGEVFVARQISLDREVALKILQDKFTNDKEYIDGLFYEARAAAKVNHPNVVQAYAVGEEDGIYYFAMELIRGETFKHIIQKEKVIAQDRALKVIKEIAGALDAAWREQKLVHQDIKPDNIMLDANGFAKLADLGLARKAGTNDEHAEAGDEVFGTPQYISPEQLTGIPTDVRSDIYSLGATFYQMVTGRFAYLAETVEEMSQKHVEGNLEPPQSVNPELSDEVNAIIMKMMARNIEDRYQDPRDLIKDIDDALMNSGRKVKTPPALKLKLKTPGAAAPKKAAVPAKAPAAVPRKAAVPAAPAKSTPPPSPAKSAPPPAPAKSTLPSAPANSAPPPAPEKTAVPEEEKPAAKQENAPAQPAVQAQENNTNKSTDESQQSVRSALLAKHQEDKNDEAESEEIDAIIADNKTKRNKKVLWISLGSVAALLVIALGTTVTLFFCADAAWMPDFAKPAAAQIKGLPSAFGSAIKAKLAKSAAKPAADANTKPSKPVIVTRQEYLAKVDSLLTEFRNNPDAKSQWLAKANADIEYILKPVTGEERRAAKPLLNIYNRVDEQVVFAPYREKEEAKRLAAITKAQEAERLAREADARRLQEEEQRRKENEQRLEAERKQIEKERSERLAKLKVEITGNITQLAKSAVIVFRGGADTQYQAALQNCLAYAPPYAENNEEQKLLNYYKSGLANIRKAVGDLQKFNAKVKDLSGSGIMTRLKTSNGSQMVSLQGIDPDGTIHYKTLAGKPGKTTLAGQQNFRFANQIKNTIKENNCEFYLMLIAGRNVKQLTAKAPAGAWKNILTVFAKEF